MAVGRGLCGTDVSASTLARHLSKNAVPQAGRAAGRYYTVSTALTLAACTVNCCAVPHCNVVLFVRRQCLLVACNASVPHGCEPRHQPADGDKTAYMINVRSVGEQRRTSHGQVRMWWTNIRKKIVKKKLRKINCGKINCEKKL